MLNCIGPNISVGVGTYEQDLMIHTRRMLFNSTGNPSKDNAFLSPRWGGLHIHNLPTPGEGDRLPKPVTVDMKEVMQIFISQLRMLIGINTQVTVVIVFNCTLIL